jgi:hypothetical protein
MENWKEWLPFLRGIYFCIFYQGFNKKLPRNNCFVYTPFAETSDCVYDVLPVINCILLHNCMNVNSIKLSTLCLQGNFLFHIKRFYYFSVTSVMMNSIKLIVLFFGARIVVMKKVKLFSLCTLYNRRQWWHNDAVMAEI